MWPVGIGWVGALLNKFTFTPCAQQNYRSWKLLNWNFITPFGSRIEPNDWKISIGNCFENISNFVVCSDLPLKILAGAFLNIFVLQVFNKLSGNKLSRNRGISCPWSLEPQISNLKKLGHPVQICPQNYGKIFFEILKNFCFDMCSNAIIHLSRKFYGPSCYNKNVQICPENFFLLFRFAPMHKNAIFLVIVRSSTIKTIGFTIF